MTPQLNVPIRVIVGSLSVGADSFVGQTGRKYCHHCSLILSDETVIKAQICTDTPEFNSFKENDKIDVTLTNYRASAIAAPYSFKFMGIAASAEVMATKPITSALTNNPVVAGTVSDRALTHAIAMYSTMGRRSDELITTFAGTGKKTFKLEEIQDIIKNKTIIINEVINVAYILQDYFTNSLKEKE